MKTPTGNISINKMAEKAGLDYQDRETLRATYALAQQLRIQNLMALVGCVERGSIAGPLRRMGTTPEDVKEAAVREALHELLPDLPMERGADRDGCEGYDR